MPRGLVELYSLYAERRAEAASQQGTWREIARLVDDSLWVVDPGEDEIAQAAVPDIISQGINGYARRAASVQPDIDCAALRPNIASSVKRAIERAEVYGEWWRGSLMSLADFQSFRYFFAYGAMPSIVRSDKDQPGLPRWEVLNPAGVYPGPKALPYSPVVPDCFRVVSRSCSWVTENYGVTWPSKYRPDTMVEVVEYIDAEQVAVFCVGPAGPATAAPSMSGRVDLEWSGMGQSYGSELRDRRIEHAGGANGLGPWLVMLSQTPNFAERCLITYTGQISLSRQKSLIEGIIGKFKLQAEFMDLWKRGIARGVYPREWVSLDADSNGQVEREPNPKKGIAGIIRGGSVQMLQLNPGYQSGPYVDRIESYMRSEAGISPEWGGESGSNIRTGRRGGQVLEETVEPVLAEAHRIAQVKKEEELRTAIAIAKGYGGGRTFSMYVGENDQRSRREYVPDVLFENDEVRVSYPVVGADVSQLIIAAGQSQGTGVMSDHDARVLNPLVVDVASTETRLRAEAAEKALLASLAELVATSPEDAAWITRKLREGDMPEDVWEEAQRRAQERQATAGAPGEPAGPVVPGAPEAQPGLGLPGGPAQAGATPPGPQSLRDIAFQYANLRGLTRTVPAERAS